LILPENASNIAILGAGISGLAAAQRVRERGLRAEVFEKEGYSGGHTYSFNREGFTFDIGPHVSFTKRPEIQEFLARGVKGEFYDRNASVTNYWYGHWIKHPAQTSLHGLPLEVVTPCLIDMARAIHTPEQPVTTYADWCIQSLGETFSRQFTFRYTEKYWTARADQMSAEWVGNRVYRPKLDEALRGALAPQDANFHYVSKFRYPKTGGFHSYLQAVEGPVHLGKAVSSIDLQRRQFTIAGAEVHGFDALISSLPLPTLISLIKDVPAAVKEAVDELVCTSLVLVNIGVERNEGFPGHHWMYFYDEDIIFARANYPHMLSPANAPKGCSSIQVEIYHSRYKPLEVKDTLNRTIDDLTRIGMLKKDDKIRVAYEQRVPYANVLFDLHRAENLKIVQSYLNEKRVHCCGRYGEWAYYWTDDSILSGWRAAEAAVSDATGQSA
jgi:protoporphyrinogen oxidase